MRSEAKSIAFPSFPLEAEEPQIAVDSRRRTSINVGIIGPQSESTSESSGKTADGSAGSDAKLIG